MLKRIAFLILPVMLGIFICGAACIYDQQPAGAQKWDWRTEYPDLNDAAAWAKIEQRRQARLEMVQGVTEFNAKNYSQAVKHFEKFVEVFPGDPQGLKYLGLAQEWAAKSK